MATSSQSQTVGNRMKGNHRKNETNLHEEWMEKGGLLPGTGTSEESREAWQPAWRRGAAAAAPALSMVFRNATQPAHTRPRRPQSSIYCPDLAAAELDSTSSALLQKGGCFACAPFSPQGWSCPLPVFRGLLSHSRSSFSVGVFPGPAVSRNYSDSALITVLTPFHRKQSATQDPVG